MCIVSHFNAERDLVSTSVDSELTSSQNFTSSPLGRATQPISLLQTDFYYMKTAIE